MEQLLLLDVTDINVMVRDAANLLATAFRADKVDLFFYDDAQKALIAVGTSDTPMGRKQKALGLDVMPIAGGGRTVESYLLEQPYLTRHADEDPGVLDGIKRDLGVRSMMLIPLPVAGARRGVIAISTYAPDRYSEESLRYLEAVAGWVGVVIHRAELVQHELRQAEARARRVVAEELLTFLAHDLKNYIMPIAMRLNMLRAGAEAEGRATAAHALAEVRQGLAHISALTDSLLDVARLEQGNFALHFAESDLVTLIDEVLDTLDPYRARCLLEAPAALPAYIDPVRVQALFANLLSNALKYTVAPVRVTLRQEGEWAHVTVRDEGGGIAPELLPHIFHRYATGSTSPGLGIGLYMAKQIAAAHGGTITFESDPGRGTIFDVTLPALFAAP